MENGDPARNGSKFVLDEENNSDSGQGKTLFADGYEDGSWHD